MEKIQAIIFDLNGVFIISRYLSERFLEDFGVPVEEFMPVFKEVLRKARQPEADDVFTYFEPSFKKWGIMFTKEEFYDYWFGSEHEVPEMVELAKRLKKEGVKLFILSNNFRSRREYYDKNFAFLNNLFDAVYFSFESGYIKTEPEAFETVLRAHKLNPKHVLFFDDSQENVDVAKRLGIQAHLFKDPDGVKAILEKANI